MELFSVRKVHPISTHVQDNFMKVATFTEFLKEIIEIQKSLAKNETSASNKIEALLNAIQTMFDNEAADIARKIINDIQQDINATSDKPDKKESLENEIYSQLLPFMKIARCYEKTGDPEAHAKKLAIVFGNKREALNYLAKTSANSTVNNACSFTLPSETECDFKVWMGFAKKYLADKQFQICMTNAHEIELLAKQNNSKYQAELKTKSREKTNQTKIKKKKLKLEKVNKEWKDLDKHHGNLEGYKNKTKEENKARHTQLIAEKVTLNQKLLNLSAGIPLKDADLPLLNAYNEAYKLNTEKALKYMLDNGLSKHDYAKFIKLERKNDDEKIPPILIDGNKIGYPGYYLKKIDVMDERDAARAACLGKKTKCCQSLSGEAGEPCVIHGLTSPNGGFYILCKGDPQHPDLEDEIVAQCWAWRSQTNAIVLDSIEGPTRGKEAQKIAGAFFRGLAKELVTSGKTHKVVSGVDSASAIKNIGITALSNPAEKFIDYESYYDSGTQSVLYDKDCPFYLYQIDQECTEKTEALLQSISSDNSPLASSHFLINALNWALINSQQNLYNKILEIMGANRTDEINHLITILKKYINNNLTADEILSSVEKNPLLVNIVNQQGISPLMWAIQNDLTDTALRLIEKGANINANDNDGKTALMWAAEKGNNQVIKALLSNGADMNAGEKTRKTAMMIAAEMGHFDIVTHLHDHGAKIDAANRYGYTALLWAIHGKKNNVALKLIELGAKVFVSNDKNQTALMLAIQNNMLDVALELINKGADINVKDSNGQTALMLASLKGHKEIVNRLLSQGAEVEAKDDKGKTALMYAANPEIVSLLTTKGAKINVTDKQGKNALLYSIENRLPAVALQLIELDLGTTSNNKSETALILAAKYGYKEVVDALITKKTNVNAKDNKNKTALMHAAKKGFKEITFELMAKNIEINGTDSQGKTLLMYAAQGGDIEIVNEIANKGADIHIKDKNGRSALMWANNEDVIQELIKRGATINDSDNDGFTPLILAIENERNSAALQLIKQGAQVNHTTKSGLTPLMIAAKEFNCEMVAALMENGADINAKNDDEKTALMLTKDKKSDKEGFEEMALLLIENGADFSSVADDEDFEELLIFAIKNQNPLIALKLIDSGANLNITDREGKTALMWAAEKGYQELVQALVSHGIDVNAVDDEGKTALIWAAIGGKRNVAIAHTLIDHGSVISTKDNEGKTALAWSELNATSIPLSHQGNESSRKGYTPGYTKMHLKHPERDEFDKCLCDTLLESSRIEKISRSPR